MWIGIDDTDGPDGGCTTFVLSSIVGAAPEHGIDLIGYPRLVRLNPNVPWKTRGNGALAARFGHGIGRTRRIGEIGGRPVRTFDRGVPLTRAENDRWFETVRDLVIAGSSNAPRTDPAVVSAPRRPTAQLYRRAVTEVVPGAFARRALREVGGRLWYRRGARGVVGATAAMAWPGRRPTFELLAYRTPGRLGSRRDVDASSVRDAGVRHPELFLCHDPLTRRLLVAPHTACPILFGLRATDPAVLPGVLREIRSEPVDRWLIFETNQASGDHLVRRAWGPWPAYSAGSVVGVVQDPPSTIPGGHVRFALRTLGRPVAECWVFEPTKTLVGVARSLRPGDRIRVDGGRGRTRVLHVERLTLLHLEPRRLAAVPPRCERCRRRAESRGAGRGFRCPGCRQRFPPESARSTVVQPEYPVGTYDPTPSARRHLHPRGPEPA